MSSSSSTGGCDSPTSAFTHPGVSPQKPPEPSLEERIEQLYLKLSKQHCKILELSSRLKAAEDRQQVLEKFVKMPQIHDPLNLLGKRKTPSFEEL